jgi:hypothetical protein
MKTAIYLLAIGIVFGSPDKVWAQEKPASTAPVAMNAAETKFQELLANSTLEGRWAPINDGALGEEKQDKYTIVSATKVRGDSWVITARMKFGEKEVAIPFPVEVKWAGDTPVIVVDNLPTPGGRTYSARVLFYEKTYAGSWTGGGKAGLLSGIISKNQKQ